MDVIKLEMTIKSVVTSLIDINLCHYSQSLSVGVARLTLWFIAVVNYCAGR